MATYMIRKCDSCGDEERLILGEQRPIVVCQSGTNGNLPSLFLELCVSCYGELLARYKKGEQYE